MDLSHIMKQGSSRYSLNLFGTETADLRDDPRISADPLGMAGRVCVSILNRVYEQLQQLTVGRFELIVALVRALCAKEKRTHADNSNPTPLDVRTRKTVDQWHCNYIVNEAC